MQISGKVTGKVTGKVAGKVTGKGKLMQTNRKTRCKTECRITRFLPEYFIREVERPQAAGSGDRMQQARTAQHQTVDCGARCYAIALFESSAPLALSFNPRPQLAHV